jgi:uncharacterized protein YoxC
MNKLRQDLRATQESIRRDAESVLDIEERKERLDPGDEEVEDLSERVMRLATSLKNKAAAEKALVEEIQAPG